MAEEVFALSAADAADGDVGHRLISLSILHRIRYLTIPELTENIIALQKLNTSDTTLIFYITHRLASPLGQYKHLNVCYLYGSTSMLLIPLCIIEFWVVMHSSASRGHFGVFWPPALLLWTKLETSCRRQIQFRAEEEEHSEWGVLWENKTSSFLVLQPSRRWWFHSYLCKICC